MAYNNDPIAEEVRDKLLCKFRAKSFSIDSEFKERLLTNEIFLSGASSDKLIVSYRSARARNDQHKRDLILKKLEGKIGKVQKVINSGAKNI